MRLVEAVLLLLIVLLVVVIAIIVVVLAPVRGVCEHVDVLGVLGQQVPQGLPK